MSQIAVDAHVIEGRPQGTRTVLTNLLRAVAAIGRAGDFSLYCSDVELCRSRLGIAEFQYMKTPARGRLARLLWALPAVLARNRPRATIWQHLVSPLYFGESVLFVHDLLPLTHPKLFPLAFRLRCRVTFSYSIARAAQLVVLSQAVQADVARRYPRKATKVSRIHPGGSFDPGAYFDGKVEASPHPRPYILSVGRIEARKNIPLLARAFVHAGLPDIDLVIVGKRDLGYSAALPENDRIVVREEVDDRQLVALYRHASLFVFPSEAEGFGLPLLDAVLFGLPTIASNRTSLPEVGGDLATYFDPTGPAAVGTLATMIGGHFTDRPIPSPSPEGRAAHAGKYNWERAAHELTDALDRWQLQTAAT